MNQRGDEDHRREDHKPEGSRLLLTILAGILELLGPSRHRDKQTPVSTGSGNLSPDQTAALAQFHAAEYASERNSVDVWKTLQYALVPIMFGSWYLLSQFRGVLPLGVFRWACAAVLPLCYVAYQKAMVDALTGILLIEEHVRPRAIQLAGTDEFWFHEPVYRKQVPADAAYGWFWPPILSFAAPMAMLAYRVSVDHSFSPAHPWPDALGYVVCLSIAWFVGGLSKKGLALNRQVDQQIRRHNFKWVKSDTRTFSLRFKREQE